MDMKEEVVVNVCVASKGLQEVIILGDSQQRGLKLENAKTPWNDEVTEEMIE